MAVATRTSPSPTTPRSPNHERRVSPRAESRLAPKTAAEASEQIAHLTDLLNKHWSALDPAQTLDRIAALMGQRRALMAIERFPSDQLTAMICQRLAHRTEQAQHTPEQIVEGIPPWARQGALEYAHIQIDRERDVERRIQALILKPLESEQSKRDAVCDLLTQRLP